MAMALARFSAAAAARPLSASVPSPKTRGKASATTCSARPVLARAEARRDQKEATSGLAMAGVALAAAACLAGPMVPSAEAKSLVGSLPSIFAGEYSDPKHPGCLRKVESSGKITGTDGTPGCLNGETQKAWELKGVIDEDEEKIFIDFRPKGGPADLIGVWSKEGIRFPDGNLWKKIN